MPQTPFPDACVLCTLGQNRNKGLSSETGIVVVYLDDGLMALLQHQVPGVILAPKQHIGSLSMNPERSAAFLAALRRTVTEVQGTLGASGAMIEPTTAFDGAAGHVCYRVIPTRREDEYGSGLASADEARRFSEALRDFLAPDSLTSGFSRSTEP